MGEVDQGRLNDLPREGGLIENAEQARFYSIASGYLNAEEQATLAAVLDDVEPRLEEISARLDEQLAGRAPSQAPASTE